MTVISHSPLTELSKWFWYRTCTFICCCCILNILVLELWFIFVCNSLVNIRYQPLICCIIVVFIMLIYINLLLNACALQTLELSNASLWLAAVISLSLVAAILVLCYVQTSVLKRKSDWSHDTFILLLLCASPTSTLIYYSNVTSCLISVAYFDTQSYQWTRSRGHSSAG